MRHDVLGFLRHVTRPRLLSLLERVEAGMPLAGAYNSPPITDSQPAAKRQPGMCHDGLFVGGSARRGALAGSSTSHAIWAYG